MTDSKPSKSERKREHLALQELGEKLIALKEADLSTLSLDESLLEAVRDAAAMKSRGALRRQKQLIGKLMRRIDPAPIREGIARLSADDLRDKQLFARAERWRDRIIRDGTSALDAFEVETRTSDPDLRLLIREFQDAFSDRDETTIRRKIFRRIHEILVRIPQ